ncbi:flagellar hook-length control protein FliK [Shewanella sp. Isolate13]|uniref:flagellar hook-length control protein FliK n=1 Tax=Shewanella sp. Isolate13 TaxID=2908531 RepID=UPI001EFE6565|nr:flagellar hook-length control protein FliK [Shewanella sp. Isolate13]MCG9729270.1 flagellar hook-length control protein FliK [Shewanella sp. Isolate13]
MQQMTNVLLSSPDSSRKVADSQSKSTEPKTSSHGSSNGSSNVSSQGGSFSAALDRASGNAFDKKPVDKPSYASAAERQKTEQQADKTQSSSQKDVIDDPEAIGEQASNGVVSQASHDVLNEEKSELAPGSDDVSQIFAQINLANNLANNVANNLGGDSQLAVNGESLPLSAEQLESNSSKLEQPSDELAVSDLSDEALIALSLQSGLSEQELSKLSSSELKALLQQGQMLDASGGLKPEFAVVSTLQPSTGEMSNGANKAEGTTMADKAAISSTVTDTKSPNAVDVKGIHTGRDIFGKEVSGQGANQVIADQAKAAQNADGANANNVTNNMPTSLEQLKGAELSVRTTASQAGLEVGSSGMTESGAQDLKSFTGLQSQQLHQQGASRQELPQFNLSLKPVGEQAPQMQQMIQRFSPVMNQQLITMVSKGIQQAEIRLDPPELGHMMVRIQVQGDSTQVQFQVSQHQTRELVEQAMPRLREMLAEQGMQLTDGQVSQGNGGNSQGEQGLGNRNGHGESETDEISAEEMLARSNLSTSSASGIDYYA